MKSFNQNFTMSILVDGKSITEYSHENTSFVEGRSGNEYTIRVQNLTYGKACFIVSVDGLSVLDGKECGDTSPGYVLGSHETLDIACYTVDDNTGAKFVFGTKEKSYSNQIGKGTDNVGVIAVKIFQEEPQPRTYIYHDSNSMGGAITSGRPNGSAGTGWNTDYMARGITASAAVPEPEESIGTVFGGSMTWQTRIVEFKRQPFPSASMIIYYDTRKNLERRGIKFESKAPQLPNPFPANTTGVTPPQGWHK